MLQRQLAVKTSAKLIWAVVAVIVGSAGVWLLLNLRHVDTKAERARVQLEMTASALRDYSSRHGRFPTEAEGLGALVSDGDIKAPALVDPWGRPIAYKCASMACMSAVLTVIDMTPSDGERNRELSRLVEHK